MRGTHIVNPLTSKTKNEMAKKARVKNQPMVIHRAGMVITIPVEAMNITGFLKKNVADRIFAKEPSIENIQWLNEKYGVEFVKDNSKEVAING